MILHALIFFILPASLVLQLSFDLFFFLLLFRLSVQFAFFNIRMKVRDYNLPKIVYLVYITHF